MLTEKIVVSVLVRKPVELVWSKWLHAIELAQSCTPYDGWHCRQASNDLREGGHFHFRMEEENGKEGLDVAGRYDTITPLQLISCTLTDARSLTIEFQPIDENTIIRKSITPHPSRSLQVQQTDCQTILERFKEYVEKAP